MSNETTEKTTRAKTAKASAEDSGSETATKQSTEPKQSIKAKDVDIHQYITVRNGFQGKLIYISKHTGEKFEWDGFGSEQEMELNELKHAKNSNKQFFTNNWFMFDDPWVIEYLGVRQYYKNTVPIDDFDDIFQKDPKELAKLLKNVPDGQKRSIAYRARQLIEEDAIDSLNTVKILEKELGVDLIEH